MGTIMFKAYYHLTKPGIIYGNMLTALAGFLLGAQGDVHIGRLCAVIVGTSLVIGAACVFNNYIDRDIDARMARTKKRGTVTGAISPRQALIYASVLGVVGFTLLTIYTNTLTVIIGGIGFIDYVLIYTQAKRRTVHATLIGTVCGATPIAAGYTAATNTLDTTAMLLFLVMVLWQLPHFYAISIFRKSEYAAANVPVAAIIWGIARTKRFVVLTICLFILASTALTLTGGTGYVFLGSMLLISGRWLMLALHKGSDDTKWARRLFLFSLIVVLGLSFLLSVDWLLP